MFKDHEEKFLNLALEQGLLEEEEVSRVLDLTSKVRRPLPFVLLEEGILHHKEIDSVLSAMLSQVDQAVSEADSLRRAKEYEEAIARYSAVINSNPSLENGYWGRASAYKKRGQLDLAIADYTKLIELSDRVGDALYRRGRLRAQLGDWEGAEQDQRQSIAYDSSMFAAYFELGICVQRRGDHTTAIEFYTKSIELAPDFIEAYNNRAIAHLLLKDISAAERDWQICVRLDGSRKTIRRNLKTLMNQVKRDE